MSWEIREGDALERLREMPDESVQCCVTSPPYWGLRDYGSEGQLGLEPTPEEYVANLVGVFREVRRVLRDDGTLWLNLGDSFCSTAPSTRVDPGAMAGRHVHLGAYRRPPTPSGMKPKDLVGIPWMVAKALRAPYYTGRIRDERDRIWLAAMIDAEGCIYIHKRKPKGERKSDTYGPGLEIANTSSAIIERVATLVGRGSVSRQSAGRKQEIYRWHIRTNECRELLREVYPYLVAKQHQARIAIGCPSADGEAAHEALKLLHGGGLTDVDFPAPASMFEPGWYLRSDIIWSKPNPMPESVTDRPTKAHEYLFLLSKSPRYFYDAEAIRESAVATEPGEMDGGAQRLPDGSNANDGRNFREVGTKRRTVRPGIDTNGGGQGNGAMTYPLYSRNKRSVWTVTTRPFAEAHFATFPPKLIEPCILAGSRPGDTVLDPFAGAATTGLVATRLDRSFIGIELNPEYVELGRNRIRDDAPLLNVGTEVAPDIGYISATSEAEAA